MTASGATDSEGGVGTGAGEGAPRQDAGSAWVTRSEDCPEAPAQAHPLAIDPAAVVSDEAYAAGYRDGRAEVSAPAGLTISDDGALLNWLGVNYVRQGEILSAEIGERAECATCSGRGVWMDEPCVACTPTVENGALFFVWYPPALDLAAEHGCLDEDVETGDPLACGACITAASALPSAKEGA